MASAMLEKPSYPAPKPQHACAHSPMQTSQRSIMYEGMSE